MPSAAERKRREERVKLFATALSNVGVATVVTGFIVPLLTGRSGLSGFGAVVLGFAFHLAAQRVLQYVADEPKQEANTWIGR